MTDDAKGFAGFRKCESALCEKHRPNAPVFWFFDPVVPTTVYHKFMGETHRMDADYFSKHAGG